MNVKMKKRSDDDDNDFLMLALTISFLYCK